MKINPVYKRETTVGGRSFRLALIIMIFNMILAMVALISMYSTVASVRVTAQIQYSGFLSLYAFVASLEFVMLIFIMPAITAGSISGERERRTLELMLTTRMKPSSIISGKIAAACSTLFILIISSFPVLALVFVYGGITISDVATLLTCYITVAVFAGSIGICSSAVFKRTTTSTAVTYGTIIILILGTLTANLFAQTISEFGINTADAVSRSTGSGNMIYILLINPAITFYIAILEQSGNMQAAYNITSWFGVHNGNFIFSHWVAVSIVIQLIISAVLLVIAIRNIDPLRTGKKKSIKQK